MTNRPIRIATRASRLAQWQANHVAELLRQVAEDREIQIVNVTTVGDRDQSQSLAGFGGIGVFTREIQKAVLDCRADVGVHSLKDLPTDPVEGLTLAAVPQRGPQFDALVLPRTQSGNDEVAANTLDAASVERLDIFSENARVGTGSLRRRAQLLHLRPDLEFGDVRGNVETRLQKLDDGRFDALILAEAGLRRLGLDDRISATLVPPTMYPAVGQGALGVECRDDDANLLSILDQISDPPTYQSVTAERSLLAELRAGCHAPLGVATECRGSALTLEAVVLSPDGRQRLIAVATATDPESLGRQVAEDLTRQGADAIISNSRSTEA